jgi:hypothetical protein
MCAGPDNDLRWYSDVLSYELIITGNESETRAPKALSKIPAEDPWIPGNPFFLSADHPWFVAMQQVRPQLPTFSGPVALAVVLFVSECCIIPSPVVFAAKVRELAAQDAASLY